MMLDDTPEQKAFKAIVMKLYRAETERDIDWQSDEVKIYKYFWNSGANFKER